VIPVIAERGTMTITYLEPEEMVRMENTATCLRDKLLIRLLSHLGCRVSEALALTVEDIDFNNATICILHLKTRLKLSCTECGQRLGRSHTFCPKCGSKVEESRTEEQQHRRQRVLPIDRDTLKMLKEYIKRGGPVLHDEKKFIFGVNRHRAWQIVKECAEKAGLPKLVNPETGRQHNVSPHRLRDAFAVHAAKLDDSGDGLRLLQEHLGHQSFNTTAKYRKVAGEEHRQWYQRLWSKETNGDATSQA
jgi:integrase/recombinase XerD